ncbi:MAG: alpha/beta hydrolase [Ilumatobacteraceae bacterium]|jgi:pimeloyl-ACP methyl ester carboxylesterase|nr:alpha/beta hydrolase [Ilumatobacteraceae bacterium]
MTHVFVHGNPETAAIWGPLVEALRDRGVDDVALLSPPGFGAPTPAGWGATRVEYRDWLLAELGALPRPIHLVGHDWGAGHVYGVLGHQPGAVDSWVADCAGLIHPDYVWHDAAQLWQTAGTGEEMIAGWVAMAPAERAATLEPLGIPADIAAELASALDEEMGRCILALYRSAAQPVLRELGDAVAAAGRRPGLVIIATDDHYAGTPAMATEVARRVGADTVTLAGLGHWWMLQRPDAAADALIAFWATT